jgi:hypothetical protein
VSPSAGEAENSRTGEGNFTMKQEIFHYAKWLSEGTRLQTAPLIIWKRLSRSDFELFGRKCK